MSWQVPPAASIRSRADFENSWACTVSFFVELAAAQHLDRDVAAGRQAAGLQRREVDRRAVVEPRSRSSRLTGCVCVRNGSNGIDIFLFGPRSLRIRMWIGFWPPSKRARSLAPAREP